MFVRGRIEGVCRLSRHIGEFLDNPPVEGRLHELLRRQHGLVSRAQLFGLGVGKDAIYARARKGALNRVERGVYRVGHDKLSDEGRWMAAVLARGAGAVLSHRAAGMHWGIWRRSSLIEVTVPRSGGRMHRGVVIVHRCAALPQSEVTCKNGIPVTRPPRTVLDIAEVAMTRQVEQTVDEAERLRLCSEKQLRAVVARSPGRVGAAHLAAVLDDHAIGSTATVNDFEELFLGLCRERGLPQPEVNVPVGPYKPDFLWREERLIVETDGRGTHLTRKAFEADRARDAELVTAGWRVVRFTWRRLTLNPEHVADTVLKLLQAT